MRFIGRRPKDCVFVLNTFTLTVHSEEKRMKTRIAVVALGVFVAPLLAQSPMREGNWEVKMQMEMPGAPVKMPEQTVMRCVTADDLKSPGSTLPNPSGRGNDSSCKVTDQKVEGNTVTWKMACSGQGAMTGDGKMVFNGDSYTSTMNMTMPQGSMTMKYTGKRVGDCKK
jgi:hypothetical protein